MNVTIIGAGNMGKGIGTRMMAAGAKVTLIDQDQETADRLAEALNGATQNGGRATAAKPGARLTDDLVILAVYAPAVPQVIKQYADQLAGKILVDIANPLNESFDDLATQPGTSNAEETARLAPPSTRVLKAFNTTFAGTLEAGQVDGRRLDVLIAGDDAEAKATLAGLVEAGGMRPIDVGPLKRARQLEGMGLLHITLQERLGTNWMSAVKLLS
jgi:NADPH-dependent F420 reductase